MLPGRRCELGWPGPMRDRLVEAVLTGEKTATSSLLREWHEEQEQLPHVGERQVVVDSADNPVAVVEIVGVETIRLGDADGELAVSEGEGFNSVDDWRQAHEDFWVQGEARPPLFDGRWKLEDDTEIVVERFRVVTRLSG